MSAVTQPTRARRAYNAGVKRAICLSALALTALLAACSGDENAVALELTMEGAGMDPTISTGDHVKIWHLTGPIEQGQVIAFYLPRWPHRVSVKRVIALPGQTVEIDDATGKLRVDGEIFDGPYADTTTECGVSCNYSVPGSDPPRTTLAPPVPIDLTAQDQDEVCHQMPCYFVLGDNRPNSSDSRQGWLVPLQNVIGFWSPRDLDCEYNCDD